MDRLRVTIALIAMAISAWPALALGLLPAGSPAEQLAIAAMAHAGDDGLDAARYRNAGDTATSFLRYMRELRAGRPDLKALDGDVSLPSNYFDADADLKQALQANHMDELVSGLAPPDPQYAALKRALADYRSLAARGGWPVLPAGLDQDSSAGQALLRQRLSFEDPAVRDSQSDLKAALMRYQARNGLVVDGKAGRRTLAALNVPASVRADIIAANMERWRWMPRKLEADRIMINAADATLTLWLGGIQVLESRVVVGRPSDPTPILRAEGAGITINPFWTVPASIAAKEILPKLKRDPSWLAHHDMVLLNGPADDPHGEHIDWRRISARSFPYRIRQNPGAENPLGRIKIELPNRFDVYLHDTPGKSAFELSARGLSHGCVRVEQILPLASYALSGSLDAVGRITQAIDSGDTQSMPMRDKLPVYFLYWTAFVDKSGTVQFRPDLYGRDRRLIAATQSIDVSSAKTAVACHRA